MLKKIGIVVVVVLVVVIAAIATRPAAFEIKRQTTIAAAPALVYAHLEDLHKWQAWSPWAKLDPAMKITYEGPSTGVGAIEKWTGNDKVGEGSMKVTGVKPNQLVQMDLTFVKPFQAQNKVEMQLTPDGAGTKVAWVMSGENGFMAKAMSMVMDMDKMVGSDFETGLASLKTLSEDDAKKAEEARKAAEAAAAAAAAAQPGAMPGMPGMPGAMPPAPGAPAPKAMAQDMK